MGEPPVGDRHGGMLLSAARVMIIVEISVSLVALAARVRRPA
jgi:hypothetical protein